MKKLIVFIVAVILLCPALASAEVDLSGMSFDELVSLRDQINYALMETEEWEEVTVPCGAWKVGEDIPAGKWTITAVDGAYVGIEYGSTLDESGMSISYYSKNYYVETIISPSSYIFQKGQDTAQVDIELKNGNYFCVTSGEAVFTPYAGKPNLGFKKK
jgi:hypothetical protein